MEHVSSSFLTFMNESGSIGTDFMEMAMKASRASALDKKLPSLPISRCCRRSD